MFKISLITFLLGAACGNNNNNPVDAPPDTKVVPPIDAAVVPHIGFSNNEGGEIRLEWIETNTHVIESRATAFFYKSQTPANHALPNFPGCVDATAKDTWPLAQGTIVPQDVGDVIISSNGNGPDLMLTRDDPAAVGAPVPTTCANTTGTISSLTCAGGTAPAGTACTLLNAGSVCTGGGTCTGAPIAGGCDFLARPHALSWKKMPLTVANTTDGPYLPPDSLYNITFTGSSDWPAQQFNNVPFMPANWMPTTPAYDATNVTCTGGVGGSPNNGAPCTTSADCTGTTTQGTCTSPSIPLLAGTPLVLTLMPDASQNLPPASVNPEDPYQVNTSVAFTGAGIQGPIVICQQDGTSATVTIPAALVDLLRMHSPGKFVRQHLTHRFMELNDGTPVAPADRKRIDVLTVWCYNSPWVAAP